MKNNPQLKISQLQFSEIPVIQQMLLKGGDGDGDIGIEDYIDG